MMDVFEVLTALEVPRPLAGLIGSPWFVAFFLAGVLATTRLCEALWLRWLGFGDRMRAQRVVALLFARELAALTSPPLCPSGCDCDSHHVFSGMLKALRGNSALRGLPKVTDQGLSQATHRPPDHERGLSGSDAHQTLIPRGRMSSSRLPAPSGPYYTAAEAAEYIRHSPQTLANWRFMRKRGERVGPDFIKRGRNVFYTRAALDAFMLGNQAAA